MTTVVGTIADVHLLRHHIPRDDRVMMPLDDLALGLFAATGTQHALTTDYDPRLASLLAIAVVVLAQLVARARGIRTRPARATRRSPRSAPG